MDPVPRRIGDTNAMLSHLVFNFAAITPRLAGGVATVCQAMARHIPPHLPETHSSVVVGAEGWGDRYPLPPDLPCLDLQRSSIRRGGHRLLEFLDPEPGPLSQLGRTLRESLRKAPAFPSALAGGTVIHCPYQVIHPPVPKAWNLPYVMNLHDIQHEHYPNFFSPEELAWRRHHYLASAQHAMAVCVVDEWTRRDLLTHLPLEPDKVFVAPFGPTWSTADGPGVPGFATLRQKHGIPEAFAYYPAQTWPHKNHARLLEAMKLLKDRGVHLHLVCSGHLTDRHSELLKQAEELGLSNQIQFLGLVEEGEVRALYRNARLVVIPTLFEGGSGIPVLEAMALGAPLAASTACGIPDAVGDAALLFDPLNPPEMAEALGRLWTDEALRLELMDRERQRSTRWNWDQAALTYRDIYTEVLARWKVRHRKDSRP